MRHREWIHVLAALAFLVAAMAFLAASEEAASEDRLLDEDRELNALAAEISKLQAKYAALQDGERGGDLLAAGQWSASRGVAALLALAALAMVLSLPSGEQWWAVETAHLHRLTLALKVPALSEAKFTSAAFRSASTPLILFLVTFANVFLMLGILYPAAGAALPASGTAWGLAMAAVRWRADRMADQQRARLLFGRVLNGVSLGCWLAFLCALQLPLLEPSHPALVGAGCLMMALWGFCLRRSSITASSRLVSLALNCLGFAALPAMTHLGRPAEPLCLGGALMLGEALGYLLERRMRLAFLGHAAAPPPPRPAAAFRSPAVCLSALQPWTLRFVDATLEERFTSAAFQASRRPFLAFWWVCMVVVTALGALCPRLQSAMAIVFSGVALFIAARLWADRPNSDQQRARVLFGRVLLAAVAATWGGSLLIFSLSPPEASPDAFMPTIALLHGLVLIYLRHSALTHAHRLCYIAITALGFGSMPALTGIGRPGEPLLIGGALMLGEALGYLLEQHARLAFLDRDEAALPPPPCVKDILIDRVVGEGGQGTVYAGRWLGIHVAIKVTRGRDTGRRLQDEARLLARLRHPSVCTFFGATVLSDGGGALVLELMQTSLGQLLRRGEPIAVGLAARIAAEVATGISFLHGNGVMHRDIKPSNVLLDKEYHAKVADFGLARLVGSCRASPASSRTGEPTTVRPTSPETLHTSGVGTSLFMAPEVRAQSSARRGPPTVGYDERCDTFSYGMLLWSLMHEVAVPPSSASASRPRVSLLPDRAVYSGLITRCWQQDPAMRPSMQEVAAETISLTQRSSYALSASDARAPAPDMAGRPSGETVHVGVVNSCSNKLDGEPASEQEGDVGFIVSEGLLECVR